MIFVIPTSTNLVRDPITKSLIPPEGCEVQDSTFWQRRLRDGDIKIGEKPVKMVVKPIKSGDKPPSQEKI